MELLIYGLLKVILESTVTINGGGGCYGVGGSGVSHINTGAGGGEMKCRLCKMVR